MPFSTIITNILYGITIGAAYALIASGLSLVFGVMGVLNFAHGGLAMFGAYIGLTIVRLTGNFWFALFFAPVVVAVVGGIIERFSIRRLYGQNILYTLLLTFGIGMIFSNAVLLIWGGDLHAIKLPSYFQGFVKILGLYYPKFRLFVLAFSCLLIGFIWVFLNRSRWGAVIRAGLSDIETVEAFGINIRRVFSLLFIICSGIAAVAGVVIGAMRSVNNVMDIDFINGAFVVIVLGGLGSFKGALVGSLILGLTEAFGAQAMPGLSKFTTWALMAVVLLIRPEGLFPEK
jgi:branched-subunit amino acid ABC-type transport system permease component